MSPFFEILVISVIVFLLIGIGLVITGSMVCAFADDPLPDPALRP